MTVKHLAETQVRLGHDVMVLTSDACSSAQSGCENINGVEVHRIESLRFSYSDLTFPLKTPNFDSDVMHLHSQNSLFCLRVAQQGAKKGDPTVYQFLGVDYLKDHPKRLIRLFGSRYQEWVQKKALDLADGIVTPSLKDHRVLAEKYGVDSVVIPHGIGCEYLERASNPNLFRETCNIGEEKIILYIGRLNPLKGIDVLIRSLLYLEHTLNDYVLVVIGTGSERYFRSISALAKRLGIEQQIRFLGYVEEVVKISALDAASVLVLPSVAPFETFPMVVNEAWARSKAVIASAIGALPNRVKHMKNGVLVPAGKPEILAESAIEIVTDENLQKRLGEAGKKELITWVQVAKLTVDLYNEF